VTPSDRLRRLLRPPADTIAGVAALLREHWRAAARMRPARVFWPTPGRWLKARPAVDATPAGVAPVTTSPAAAGSSDKLPDPHP
jgi:hypothetical protein